MRSGADSRMENEVAGVDAKVRGRAKQQPEIVQGTSKKLFRTRIAALS